MPNHRPERCCYFVPYVHCVGERGQRPVPRRPSRERPHDTRGPGFGRHQTHQDGDLHGIRQRGHALPARRIPPPADQVVERGAGRAHRLLQKGREDDHRVRPDEIPHRHSRRGRGLPAIQCRTATLRPAASRQVVQELLPPRKGRRDARLPPLQGAAVAASGPSTSPTP